jgi:hypothetical protein
VNAFRVDSVKDTLSVRTPDQSDTFCKRGNKQIHVWCDFGESDLGFSITLGQCHEVEGSHLPTDMECGREGSWADRSANGRAVKGLILNDTMRMS